MYSAKWHRLDNAAKIFPPSTTKDDTKVFRFCCELHEDVDAETLQRALNTSLEQFPFYRFIIRRGFFWYYFEKSDIQPQVREEYKPPCAPLYDVNRANLLFELNFYRKRINLELYHALSDGMGALQFLKTIVYYYLLEKYRGIIDNNIRLEDNNASNEQRSGDAFDKYYSKEKSVKIPKLPHAYRIKGERLPESRLGIIEGHISAAALLQKTHEYHATMGEFLSALLICSIHDGMKVRDENRPVSLTIPVDLRRYFATPTARNFFSVINVSHNFAVQGKNFEDVLAQVRLSFKAQLGPEKIYERLNQLSSLEHALPIKVVPLAVKVPVLKNAAWKAEKEDSAAFSNIGKITMPAEMTPHIRSFCMTTCTKRHQVCITSFEDNLVISFSSPFISSDVQRAFFRTLSSFGLDIEIVSNTEELGAPHVVLS
ncbi:hypothetical protein [Treponema primitia]|uniref:hypothetical protein n=1 Tax=Treponema primitia TaxID=88058 RepID=UPI000255558D|nr:hypothetical protein [Treponema primitia]